MHVIRTGVGPEKLLPFLVIVLAGFLVYCGGDSPSGTTPSPAILLSRTSASFSAVVAGPSPPFQSVLVTNGSGGTVTGLNASVTYPTQPTGWLTATLSATTAPSSLTLSPAPGSLSAGTYTAAAAVSSVAASNSPQAVTVTFTVIPCPATATLMPGEYTAIDVLVSLGCVVFPTNGSATDSAEYLLVPQATTEIPDLATSFFLRGGAAAPVAPVVSAAHERTRASPASQFHDHLRELERTRAYGGASDARVAPQRVPSAAAPGDTLGNRRTFKVFSSIRVFQFADVGAIAQSVGQHIILYVDSAAPPGGLSTADYNKMRSDFDTLLYRADTAAFGRESDIDHNDRVIVLMTNVVNKLVTTQECQTSGYVAGFFYGGDIDPSAAQMFNNGEIFYTIVADPAGTLSCSHSTLGVKRVVPATLVHEFQHMISYNQHVLVRGGESEMLWLNEALSHYAEERGGRSFLPDSASFCPYVLGDLYDASLYLAAPGSHALVESLGIGGLAERGAGWLFVRYLVDQFGQDTGLGAADQFTRRLEQTSATSTGNVAQATGAPFATTAERWALANWVSDLSGFTAPPALTYKHWKFRTAFPAMRVSCGNSLPATYPLVATAGPGAGIYVTGGLHSGSAGTYQRALQGPGGAGFSVFISDGSGSQLAAALLPRLNVIRIR